MSTFAKLNLLAFLLLATSATASTEHLAPINISSAYHKKLIATFQSGYSKESFLQALVLPSLANEYLAGIRTTTSGQEAFFIEPKYSVQMFQVAEEAKEGIGMAKHYVFPPDIPDNYLKNPTKIYSRSISDDLSHRLCQIWVHELFKTKTTARDERILLDPTTYIFSAETSKKGQIIGQAVAPDRKSSVGALSSLAYALKGYASGNMDEAELENLTSAFEAHHSQLPDLSAGECESLIQSK